MATATTGRVSIPMKESHTVARQIQQLEIYLNNLVSALTRGELPVNLRSVTQIFDNAISAIDPILNLSEDRFIELYNDIPQILTAYAIDVTLSGDSYRKINDNITFNRSHRGNYWIIPTQELIDKAWLVPNPLKNLSLDRMPSLDASFDRDIINENRYHDFHTYFLVAPALVQILPIVEPLTWKLLERGKITNSQIQRPSVTITAIENLCEQSSRNNYRQDRLAHDLDELSKESSKIKNIIALQDQEINFLKTHIESFKETEDRNKYRESISVKRLDKHRDHIDSLQGITTKLIASIEEINTNLESKSKTISQDIIFPRIQKTQANSINREKPRLVQKQLSQRPAVLFGIQEIISDYYHNPREFTTKYQVKIANITKDSINANRGSEEKNVILEETNRGNYWIFNFEDFHYLVPVEDKYINQHSYTTTSTIFEGHNYTPDYQKIQLIKPAIVSIDPNTSPQTWRLQQQGELAFS
jgi:hypothetical protein